jgi:leucyl aminopeptidase
VKIDIRTSAQGSPDLVTFFVKGSPLPAGVPASEFDGAPSSTVLLRDKNQRTFVVGLGDKDKIEPDTLRRAAGAGIKQLLKLGSTEIALDLGAYADHAGPAVEGAILASYKFEGFGKDASKDKRGVLARLQVLVKENEVAQARVQARDAEIIATISNTVRGIGNLPGNMLTPAILAEKAQELAQGRALTVKIWNERHLARDGFGGILAVGRGSVNPPRLIVLEYRGGGKREIPIALVGKAVTFDTGGISIKSGAAMDEMKWDKMGGLAVLGILLAAADLKLPLNLIGLIPSAENMPGPDAYRPGDIITTRDGKTVEVLNTDAEGRLILIDAITYARRLGCTHLVDAATLTGAIVVALGHINIGAFTNDEALMARVSSAAQEEGEKMWRMPMDDEYKDLLKTPFADLANIGGRWGGAISAAWFLKEFADPVPWVHLDIAGTAWLDDAKPFMAKGPTGVCVRTFMKLAEAWQ